MKHTVPKIFLMAVLFLGFAEFVRAAEHPVKWTSEIKLKAIEEIDGLLNKPVDLSGASKDPFLTLVGDNDERINAAKFSCKEYFGYIKKGFQPASNADMGMESWFKDYCYPLQYLKKALSSKNSYLENFKLTDNPLINLPPSLGLILSRDDKEKVKVASEKGMTWKEFVPNMKVEIKSPDKIELADDDSKTTITLLAWGDFNHDGIEDILLDVAHHTKGSYHDYKQVILTKLKQDGKLVQIMMEDSKGTSQGTNKDL